MVEKKKKRSVADIISRYKTHDGPQGSPEIWAEMARQSFMLKNPNATVKEVETYMDKITKNKRKIMMD